MGLDLLKGTVRNNLEAGVIEPAMSKVKIIQVNVIKHTNAVTITIIYFWNVLLKLFPEFSTWQFATEAAITILRIDDMIRLVKDESQNEEG